MEFRDKPMENLMRLQEKDICKNVNALLLEGEQIVGAYKTVRDQVVFTSHRIIMVDIGQKDLFQVANAISARIL